MCVCVCMCVCACVGFLKRLATALQLPYSIAFGCSIRPFLDLFHSWLYIYPIFPRSSGTASFFPSFRFAVYHNFWKSRRVHSLDMPITNELFWGYLIQYCTWRVHNLLSEMEKQVNAALFWVITQRVAVIPYRRFGTTHRVPSLGVENKIIKKNS